MAKTKQNTITEELGELRRALVEVERLRFTKGISDVERLRLESASVELRERERVVIALAGEEIAAQIKASAVSLSELSKRIKARTTKLSGLPKSLDKISVVILEIIDIARRIDREI